MSARPRKLCAVIPKWVEGEVEMAVFDVLCCGPGTIECLSTIAEEMKKRDPNWETIRAAIRAARKASPTRFRLNFDRLENRLGYLFSERRRDWAQR